MTTLVRTRSGVANYRFFLESDIIVFCEGGASNLSDSDINDGKENSSSEDVSFWRSLFESCFPRLRVHFKPIGNKTSVKAHANLLIERGDKSVLFIMDRDWDQYSGEIIEHDKIIYSRGYSWENDVVSASIISASVLSIGHLTNNNKASMTREADGLITALAKIVFWPLRLQLSSWESNASFLPTNETCGGVIKICETSQRIILDSKPLHAQIKKNKALYRKKRDIPREECRKIDNIPGHVLMGLAVRISKVLLQRYGSTRRSNSDSIKDMMIEKFSRQLKTRGYKPVRDHYKKIIERAINSCDISPGKSNSRARKIA